MTASSQSSPAPPTPETLRILIVEDDPGMQRVMSDYLVEHGVDVTVATDRAQALSLFKSASFRLVVLDLRLGSDNGLDVLRELRADNSVPVIIVTGHRRDEVDRVVGLELGADDYMLKPFSLRELLARIHTVLRRGEVAVTQPGRPQERGRSCFGGWTLERRQRRLLNPAGVIVSLTKGEYALLLAFVDAPQRALSREHLLQATRIHEDVFDRSIDVQILRLRRKLEGDPSMPKMIVTERGFGYSFALPVTMLA